MLGQGHTHVCLPMSHINSSIRCGQGKKGELIPRSVLPMRQLPGALPAAGLTPAYPERLRLSFSLLLGRVVACLRGALAGHACSAADLWDAAVEELRIVAPGSWSRAGSAVSPCGWGTQWDAGPLQLMLGFTSLPLSNISHPHWCLHTSPGCPCPLCIPFTIYWRNVLSSSARNSS